MQITHFFDRFVPTHYDLSLTLDRQERHFFGTVTIHGAKIDETPIGLHAKDLEISSITLDGKAMEWQNDGDELTIVDQGISVGNHLIVVGFSGTITDNMHGLYPCYYTLSGAKKELLATQFESHHAREVFPCIDEPAAKATFSLTLTTENNVTALSNMPISSQREENGSLVTTFEKTPRMSTYLLAWVVGDLQKKTAHSKSGIEVSLWATPAQPAESLDFGLSIATRVIDFFDEYFETPYPLPKSDHVALPDFSAGAMENWGLITYREVALMVDPVKSSLDNKRQAALVIAHELSHQWFGNLVTMEWWNDLWLNESFANMMEYLAIDAIEPSWEVWLDQSSHEVVHALRRDSLDGVQSIQVDVNHPDEISALFDPAIVYAKGGRLLRMLQAYIGNHAMQAGLKAYFKKHAYQNTVADDLWECLAEASGHHITDLMHAWIQQSGYPVVHVKKEAGQLVLHQEQFFIGAHTPSEKLWPIPLAARNAAIPDLMREATLTLNINNNESVQLNHNSVSHFITHYEDGLFREILEDLPSYGDIDRLKLLNEYMLLAQAQIISPAELVPLLSRYRHEEVDAVWSIVSLAINEIKRFTDTDETAEVNLRTFVGHLARNQYQRLSWKQKANEPEEDTKLRPTIISLMLYARDKDAVSKAQELFEHYEVEDLDPNLRVAIMASVVRESTDTVVFDQLLEHHNKTHSSELQEDIVAALTTTQQPDLIDRLLSFIPDPSIVRPQDAVRWIIWLMNNRYGRTKTWQWFRDNWQWVEKTFAGDKSYDAYPRYIASILRTQTEFEEYEAFFTPLKSHAALKRNIEIGLTELAHRVRLIDQEQSAVRQAVADIVKTL